MPLIGQLKYSKDEKLKDLINYVFEYCKDNPKCLRTKRNSSRCYRHY
ncbi:MAG: hypothetical protein L6V95_06530 [Candidatus Melainabacteria bacterium]|nr:MAG: hypothetical protein L6V95_06530 [Candidatus Melainabacteria bacterium]